MMNNLKGVVRFEIDLDKWGAVVIPSTPEPVPIQPFTSLFTMEYLGATRLIAGCGLSASECCQSV